MKKKDAYTYSIYSFDDRGIEQGGTTEWNLLQYIKIYKLVLKVNFY